MYVDKINERLGWKRVVLALGVLVFIAITIIIWQLDIDWKEQIRAYGYFGVFLLSLGTSATIVFPLPGEVALFAAPGIMGLSWLGVLFLGIIAGIGAAIGEMTAYYAGRWGRAAVTGRAKVMRHHVVNSPPPRMPTAGTARKRQRR